MPVIVNGYEFSDAEMERELPEHQDAPDPVKTAMTALVLRRVLHDEAERLGVPGESDEARIDALLRASVQVPDPEEAECRRHYDAHPDHFTVGELVEARHILFQVTPEVNLDALRGKAEAVLADALARPEAFAELARANSNCPSGELGGDLGQLGRGQTVPEFEKALFATAENSILPRLLETRFGLHVLYVGRKAAGQLLPYEQVRTHIADAMLRSSMDRATRQYLHMLIGKADISGIDLQAADGPLVQ